MQLAGVPVPNEAVEELAVLLRDAGADELADRLDRALSDEVRLLALTIPERSVIMGLLDDPSDDLTELRTVLVNEHQWRQREGWANCPRCRGARRASRSSSGSPHTSSYSRARPGRRGAKRR